MNFLVLLSSGQSLDWLVFIFLIFFLNVVNVYNSPTFFCATECVYVSQLRKL
jgi:hypothetical protein